MRVALDLVALGLLRQESTSCTESRVDVVIISP
jgi:hypothetical protein